MMVKLSGAAVLALSLLAILATGCTKPSYKPADNSAVQTEDDWARLLEDSSAAAASGSGESPVLEDYPGSESAGSVSAALMEELRSQSWYVGPEVYYFQYREPGVMNDTGIFYGLAFGVTSRNWLPAYPGEEPWESKWMGRAEGRFAFGRVDYDGALGDGTPYNMAGINDFVWELRLLMGPEFPKGDGMITPFTGLAYRYLNDDSSSDPAGYERESNYLYIPLGLEMLGQMEAGWFWLAAIEFDFFIWGEQKSHLSDVGSVDITNGQERGFGARSSVKLVQKGDKADFIIEPFIRYWNIRQSAVVAGMIEPKNNTVEAGLRVAWAF